MQENRLQLHFGSANHYIKKFCPSGKTETSKGTKCTVKGSKSVLVSVSLFHSFERQFDWRWIVRVRNLDNRGKHNFMAKWDWGWWGQDIMFHIIHPPKMHCNFNASLQIAKNSLLPLLLASGAFIIEKFFIRFSWLNMSLLQSFKTRI